MKPVPASMMALAISAILAPAFAAEGRREIFEPVVLDGSVSNISGKYFVSRDIDNPGAGFTIRFIGTGVENVDLDLNGFTVSNTNAGTDSVVKFDNLRTVSVHDGAVVAASGRSGVDAASVTAIVVQDLSVRDGGQGIVLRAPELFTVRRCIIKGPSLSGIYAFGDVAESNIGTLEDNIILDTGDWGIAAFLDINGVTIRSNRIRNTTNQAGIVIQASADGAVEVRENHVRGAGGDGISIGGGAACAVANNVVGESAGPGMVIASDGCLVLNNSSNNNGDAGLAIHGDRNHVERNVLVQNEIGLHFVPSGSENTFGNNTARGNTGSPACNAAIGSCSSPDFCDAGTGNVSIERNVMPGPC